MNLSNLPPGCTNSDIERAAGCDPDYSDTVTVTVPATTRTVRIADILARLDKDAQRDFSQSTKDLLTDAAAAIRLLLSERPHA